MKGIARLTLVAAIATLGLAPAAPAAANACFDAAIDGSKVGYSCVRTEDDCVKSWGMVYGTPGPISALGYDTGCLT